MANRKLISLAAAGAGAIALTAGAAKASVVQSGTLNFALVYPSDSPPSGFTVPTSHHFTSAPSGPRFYASLFSLTQTAPGHSMFFDRFAQFLQGSKSTQFGNPQAGRVAAGKTWDMLASTSTNARLADRAWGTFSSTHGLPAGTGFYDLFRFQSAGNWNYGWIQYNIAMTQANSALAADGPNLTVVRYAWDTDPALHLAAGQTSTTPEPGSAGQAVLGALVLGAEGLRRWRKSRKTA